MVYLLNEKLSQLTLKQQRLQELLKTKPKHFQAQLDEWVRVELTYSSNHIEGNTLTRQETAEVIERGFSAVIKGKPLKDQLEALNHARAVDLVCHMAEQIKGHQFISEGDIKSIHKTILASIDDYNAGKYRQTEVFIRGVTDVIFPQPNQVAIKMRQLIEWLEGQQETHAVHIAADLHSRFITIHPFVDGNGRTGRLLMNLVLLTNDYPLAVIRAEERQEYLEAVHTLQTKNNSDDYYQVIFRAIERSLDAYLNLAQGKPALIPFGNLSKISPQKLLKIGQIAQLSQVSIPTVRYYVAEELIKPTAKSQGGFMLFTPKIVDTIKTIKQLQLNQRLSIAEIRSKLQSGL